MWSLPNLPTKVLGAQASVAHWTSIHHDILQCNWLRSFLPIVNAPWRKSIFIIYIYVWTQLAHGKYLLEISQVYCLSGGFMDLNMPAFIMKEDWTKGYMLTNTSRNQQKYFFQWNTSQVPSRSSFLTPPHNPHFIRLGWTIWITHNQLFTYEVW